MKKIIRLTESDLVRIVKRVISENTLPTFDYIFTRNDGVNEPTPGQKLYFISNGEKFDVWMEELTKDGSKGRIINTGMKVPTLDELGVVYDENGGLFKNNEAGKLGNNVAKLITPRMEQTQGNWIFYVTKDGIPSKGRMTTVNGPKSDVKGKGHKLTDGEEITGYDYFVKPRRLRKSKSDEIVSINITDSIPAQSES